MFDNLKNMANMAGMLGQARDLKQKMDQLQADLASKTVEAEAGAGAVRVVMNGKFEVISVHLDRQLLAALVTRPNDASDAAATNAEANQLLVEDLIAAAFNAAHLKAQEMIQSEMANLYGGMNLPGLDKLMGGMG